MSLFYDDEFEPSSAIEINTLLGELPFELIKESIVEQIDDPASSSTNYINVILDKCEIFKSQYSMNEEALQELNDNLIDFCTFVLNSIDRKFDLGLDINTVAAYSDIAEVTQALYKYFVLRYTKNITKFFTNFIFKNKKMLTASYSDKSKKDVSTLAFKKKIKNSDDLCILANLPSIIKFIMDLDIDSEEFISLSAKEDNYEASIVKRLVGDGTIMNNFYSNYVSLCLDSHDYIIDKIQSNIRIELLS